MKRNVLVPVFLLLQLQVAVSQIDTDTVMAPSFRQEIKSEQFNQGAISDPLQLIQGHAPGVTISKRGSDPTVFNNLLIRGVSSLYKTNPLFIVDGIWDADPTQINPLDIESFEILKDAAETSIYGSRGANGVIIIKTKTYKGDRPFSVDFDSWLSLNTQAKKLDLLTADQHRDYIQRFGNQHNEFIDGGANTDWQKEVFQNSVSHNLSLAAQGKIQNTTYRFGVSQTTNNGLVPESNRSNVGLNLNLGQTLLKERVKIKLHANYSQPKEELIPEYEERSRYNIMYNTLIRNPTDAVFNPDGTYNNIPRDFAYTNPFLIRNSFDITNEYKNLTTSGNITATIVEGLDISLLGGFSFKEQEYRYLFDPYVIWGGGDSAIHHNTIQNQRINVEPSIQYFLKLFTSDYVKASVSYRYRNELTEINTKNNRGRVLWGENNSILGYSKDIDDFESYNHDYQNILGQLEYGLQNRYFLNVKANYEMYNLSSTRKYSPFPPDTYNSFSAIYHKPIETTGFYPSVTAMWKLSNEIFMKSLTFLNNFEWKVGYGISGNNNFDQIYYEQHLVHTKDIEIEKVAEFSTGIDFALFENRVSGSLNYYNRETDNGLYAVYDPFSSNTYKNELIFKNSGLEGVVSFKALNTEILTWTSTASFSWNKIKVDNLEYSGYRGRLYVHNTDYFYTQTLDNNQPYWVFYLPEFAGISEGGQTLFYRDNGLITTYISEAEKRIFGQVIPKFELGWANNLVLFKNVEVSLSMRYLSGHSIYNATRMYLANPSATLNVVEEALEFAEQGLFMTTASNYFLEKANFLRLDHITLGYNLKPKFMGMEGNIKLYAGANNLFTLTKYKGLDPAFDFNAGGNDNFNVYPLARSFVVGVKAVF